MPGYGISVATQADLSAVAALVNSAYRGESSRAGWTTEADYIDGQRTSGDDLAAELAAADQPVLLVLRQGAARDVLACVLIETVALSGAAAGYIGMLTVRPDLQAVGLGRRMLDAAEDEVRRRGFDIAWMTVVSIRGGLISWYKRRGYILTGERRPFPYGDERFGLPRAEGLEFVVLAKTLFSSPACGGGGGAR